MRKPSGLILETNLDTGTVLEFDTVQCKHCGKHMVMWRHQKSAGHFCSHCASIICPQCAALGDCDPIRKKLEAAAEFEFRKYKIKEL
jgi:hypothetical protein